MDPVWSPNPSDKTYHYGIFLKAISEVQWLWFLLYKALVHWQSLHLRWTLSDPYPWSDLSVRNPGIITLKAISEVRRLWFFHHKGLVHWRSLHLWWTLSDPPPPPWSDLSVWKLRIIKVHVPLEGYKRDQAAVVPSSQSTGSMTKHAASVDPLWSLPCQKLRIITLHTSRL